MFLRKNRNQLHFLRNLLHPVCLALLNLSICANTKVKNRKLRAKIRGKSLSTLKRRKVQSENQFKEWREKYMCDVGPYSICLISKKCIAVTKQGTQTSMEQSRWVQTLVESKFNQDPRCEGPTDGRYNGPVVFRTRVEYDRLPLYYM